MVMQINNRWIIRSTIILAISALYACGTTGTPPPAAYTPVQGSQNMSVEEARKIILNLTRPPALFFDISKKTGVIEISNVNISTTSMVVTVVGNTSYFIPLGNIQPNVFGRGTSGCGENMDGFTEIDLNKKRQGFYFANPTNACWLVEYRENNSLTRALTSVRQGAPDIRGEEANQLADAFLILKITASKTTEEDEAHFQEIVHNYQTAVIKPSIPEEARRFKVQAEDAIKDKNFHLAADLYGQALGVVPWWPQGHFNRALVLSEIGDFPDAIVDMKRYIALVPDAPDARAAQNQIYEWELK
jgi:hypothetical protein